MTSPRSRATPRYLRFTPQQRAPGLRGTSRSPAAAPTRRNAARRGRRRDRQDPGSGQRDSASSSATSMTSSPRSMVLTESSNTAVSRGRPRRGCRRRWRPPAGASVLGQSDPAQQRPEARVGAQGVPARQADVGQSRITGCRTCGPSVTASTSCAGRCCAPRVGGSAPQRRHRRHRRHQVLAR
jgi:hypothetical protein